MLNGCVELIYLPTLLRQEGSGQDDSVLGTNEGVGLRFHPVRSSWLDGFPKSENRDELTRFCGEIFQPVGIVCFKQTENRFALPS